MKTFQPRNTNLLIFFKLQTFGWRKILHSCCQCLLSVDLSILPFDGRHKTSTYYHPSTSCVDRTLPLVGRLYFTYQRLLLIELCHWLEGVEWRMGPGYLDLYLWRAIICSILKISIIKALWNQFFFLQMIRIQILKVFN